MTTVRSTAPESAPTGAPFGLGVLDLAVGTYVYEVARSEELQVVEDFSHELRRYG